jgi:hypothetical protein
MSPADLLDDLVAEDAEAVITIDASTRGVKLTRRRQLRWRVAVLPCLERARPKIVAIAHGFHGLDLLGRVPPETAVRLGTGGGMSSAAVRADELHGVIAGGGTERGVQFAEQPARADAKLVQVPPLAHFRPKVAEREMLTREQIHVLREPAALQGVLGIGYHEISDADRDAVTALHPRPDFKRQILHAFTEGIAPKPETTGVISLAGMSG